MKTKHQLNLLAPAIQRGDQTRNNPIPRKWFALALGGLLLTSICALLPSPAQAQCQRWDVSGQWLIHHKGGGQLQLNLQQGDWQGTSANISGTGRLTNEDLPQARRGGRRGGRGRGEAKEELPDYAADISGGITSNSVSMKVTLGSFILRYRGTIDPNGRISGDYHFENKPADTKQWSSLKTMKCADEADKSSSSDTDDQKGKHKKNKKKKKHHHHDDDDGENQGNE